MHVKLTCWSKGKLHVVLFNVLCAPRVCCLDIADLIQPHFLHQSVLQRAVCPFHSSFCLGRVSADQLNAELVEQLDKPSRPGDFDQRAGYILVALSIAAIVASAIQGPTQDSFREISSLAIIPLFVGAALLLRLRLNKRTDAE